MKRLILLILCLSSIVSWGQSIKGKVIDAKTKETIPQASIVVTGVKGVGTAADLDGNFTYTLPQGKNQITVSFVGYKSKTVTVAPGQNITIALDPDASILDEMVVIGMGTQKKESLSSAVANIDVAKAIDSRPVPDLGRALQGATPGLTIRLSNGELGSDPTIRIRGNLTSLQGSSAPLILLDNVQIPSLQYINPEDVESVSILKDAASASIYGAKAANGVVLITSKKGSKSDRINVSYNGSFTMKTPTVQPKMAGIENIDFVAERAKSYRSKKNILENTPISGGFYWLMTDWKRDRMQHWMDNYYGKVGRDMVYGRDWETVSLNGGQMQNYGYRYFDTADILMKDWSPQQQHNISINGTSGKTSYNIGLGYLNQVGVTRNTVDTYDRYNISLSVNSEVNKWLKAKASFMYSLTEKCYPNITYGADAYFWAYRPNAYFPMDATYNGYYMNDRAAEIRQSNISTRLKEYIRIMVGAELTFAKGWTGDFALTYSSAKNFYHEPGQRFYGVDSWLVAEKAILDANGNQVWRDKDGNIVPAGTDGASIERGWDPRYLTDHLTSSNQAYESSSRDSRVNMSATSTYKIQLGNHGFQFMGGMQTESMRYYYHSSAKYGLSDQDKPELGLAEGAQFVSGSKTWESQLGYFGRFNYNWNDKLFFDFTGRYEAASKFPEYMRWKFFPSASAAYRISEEKWFEPIKNVVSEMKVRASWGSLGNQGVSNNEYIPTLTKTQNSTWLGYDDVKFANYSSPALVRDDLTWETITTLDFGLDARFLKNKLGLVFDWYSRTTTDLIVPGGSMPSTYGGTAPRGNFGKLRTNGWELAVDFNHRFANGLRLSATASISDNKTTMLSYSESGTKTIGNSIWYNGKVYGEIWGYKVDRLYQVSDFEEYQGLVNDDIPAADNQKVAWFYGKAYNLKGAFTEGYEGYVDPYKAIGVPSPGNIKFKDLNGDGEINAGNNLVGDSGDRVIIGNSLPRYEYSLRVDLDWKGFDLGVFFQGVGSRKVWGTGALASPNNEIGNSAVLDVINNTWQINNTGAYFPRSTDLARDVATGGSWQVSDKYLIDMSYLRIKTITLGYTLPKNISEKIQLSKLRVYVTGENLFTIDNIKHYPIDPELQTGTSLTTSTYNSDQLGVTTPIQKFISVGLQLNLK